MPLLSSRLAWAGALTLTLLLFLVLPTQRFHPLPAQSSSLQNLVTQAAENVTKVPNDRKEDATRDSDPWDRQPYLVPREVADARFKMTFQDPSSYQGPIVEGWPPGKSRDMRLYLKDDGDSVAREGVWDLCPDPAARLRLRGARLLVAVKSAAGNRAQRAVNRQTWASYSRANAAVAVVNFVARDEQENVEDESSTHCDLVQFSLVEAYMNLTLKSVSILKYILDQSRPEELGWRPEFVLITDDDTWVNVDQLWTELFEQREAKYSNFTLQGALFGGGKPLYPSADVDYDSGDHNGHVMPSVTPKYMFEGQYPWYVSGSGQLLPTQTLPCLYQQAMQLPYFHIEDVFVTGFAAKRCGFPRKRNAAFSSGRIDPVENITKAMILVHYMEEEDKKHLHEKFASWIEKGKKEEPGERNATMTEKVP